MGNARKQAAPGSIPGALRSSIAVGMDKYKDRIARRRAKAAREQEFLAREQRYWTSKQRAERVDAEIRQFGASLCDFESLDSEWGLGALGVYAYRSSNEDLETPPAYVPPDTPAYGFGEVGESSSSGEESSARHAVVGDGFVAPEVEEEDDEDLLNELAEELSRYDSEPPQTLEIVKQKGSRGVGWPYAHESQLMRDENGDLSCACLDCMALKDLRKARAVSKGKRRLTS